MRNIQITQLYKHNAIFLSVSITKHHRHSFAIIVAAQSGPQTQCLSIRRHILPVNDLGTERGYKSRIIDTNGWN